MVLKSVHFDDVYFSAQDGMDETHHVFLAGNNIPNTWDKRKIFTIAETGFGTGLNFLCAWKSFRETASDNQRLHFISVEKYPLSVEEIENALSPWRERLGSASIDRYLSLYPLRVPGPHTLHLSANVQLTIWFGDIEPMMDEWQGVVDAWFLDGFTPAKNPDMWSDAVFAHMARLSHAKTTLATFTAAGFVRRGLEQAGFKVQKAKGFGYKRDMVLGQFTGEQKSTSEIPTDNPVIIGGGLAGCSIAHHLNRRGLNPIIMESGNTLAFGASGGRLGMINPKLTAKATAHSDYYITAYAYALRYLSDCNDIEFQKKGSLHLCSDEDKARRFDGYINNLDWHTDHIMRQGNDLYYPDGAVVSPEKLCHALAAGTDVRLNSPVLSLIKKNDGWIINGDLETKHVFIANGFAAKELLKASDLPIQSVRGQVTWVKPRPTIDHNICYGGYITPQCSDGFHILGSTFQPWETDCAVRDADHLDNIRQCNEAMGADFISEQDIVGGWAALRTASKDRFPIVGSIDDGLSISTAHGSHGIISSLLAAHILVNNYCNDAAVVSRRVLSALSPKRFYK